ncbi:hypothetical protein FLA_6347 [Filimonas lacunae]|nr:hypothetical protein FLA_6347 [Filimonas lacunae]
MPNWIAKKESGLLGFLFTLSGLFFLLMQMALYISLFKYLILIIGSPVFAYLSEKTDAISEGQELRFQFSEVKSDITRGIKVALRNAGWQILYSCFLLLLSIIPIVGWATPVMAITNECFYYGFSMIDYSFARKHKGTASSNYFITHNRGLAVGNGVIFFLMHLVPVLGWVLAPAYAIIAATFSMRRVREKPGILDNKK